MLYKRNKKKLIALKHVVSFPFIFLPFIPVILLDVVMEVCHRICFPLYGLPTLKRGNYIVFDREWLSYLSWRERVYCVYCSYVNGVFAYVTKIAGETEKYWCGIKHKMFPGYVQPWHHRDFAEYGDEAEYREKYAA